MERYIMAPCGHLLARGTAALMERLAPKYQRRVPGLVIQDHATSAQIRALHDLTGCAVCS